jgi:hypothetical protein
LTEELGGLSKSVSQVAAIGLRALEDLKAHRNAGAEIRARDLEVLKAAEKPKATLLDELVGPVEALVKAKAN